MRLALSVVLILALAPDSLARRRSVASGPRDIGANFLLPMITGGDLTLTNHDSVPATITACGSGCTVLTIPPKGTVTSSFEAGLIQILSSTEELEGRSPVFGIVRRTDLLTNSWSLPLYGGVQQELVMYTTRSGSVDVRLLGSNGVWENAQSVALHSGLTTFGLSVFGNVDGKQLELIPTVPMGAFLAITDAGNKYYVAAQDPLRASRAYIVLGVTNQNGTTRVTVKNPGPDAILATKMEFYAAAKEHREPGKSSTTQTVNGGIVTFTDSVAHTGSTGTGMLLLSAGESPLVAWASNAWRPIAAAPISRSAVFGSYKLSINGVTDDDTVAIAQANESYDTVSCRIRGFDRDGNEKSSTTVTLRGKENTYRTLRSLAPGSARLELEMNAPPARSTLVPRALMATTNRNGYPQLGHQVESILFVTGSDYLNQWYPEDVWLNPLESRELLTRYTHDLAVELNKAPGSPGVSATETFLLSLVDGNTANGELWSGGDTFLLNRSASVQLYTSSDAQPAPTVRTFALPTAALEYLHAVPVPQTLLHLVQTFPERYGGNATNGPNLTFDPTWNRQN